MIQLKAIDETNEKKPNAENDSAAAASTVEVTGASSHHCPCHHHDHQSQALLKEEEPCVMVAERNADVESGLANPLDCYPPGAASAPLTFVQIHHLIEDIHEYGLLDVKMNRLLIYIFSILLYIGLNAALLAPISKCKSLLRNTTILPFTWLIFGDYSDSLYSRRCFSL